MSIYLPTDEAKISNAFLAVVGAYPGYTYMNAAKSYGLVPTVQALIDYSGLTTASALASRVASNLGLTGTALTDGTAYLTTVTFAGASSGWASNLAATLNLFATLTNNSVYGAAASAHVARINNAVSYSAVTSNTSTSVATLQAAAGAAGTTSNVGSTFVLTEAVDAVSGGAQDDTISGIIGTSGTFKLGDSINGGAGTDTLNLIDSSGTAVGLVSLAAVETVNVRILVASGTDVTEINASDWNGVTSLTNASSLAASELQFSGLATTTQVVIHGNTDISANFSNLSTADISLGAVNAGSFAGVTTYGVTAVTADATAHFSLDGASAGTIGGVAISLSGNNLLAIDVGNTADSFTITGAGSAVLFTTAQLATADASAFTGNLDLTLNGNSEVVVKGGSGNDTLRLGTTLSNSDSFDGGQGTDSIRATVAGFNRSLNTSNVESATITFTGGGELNVTGSTITSYSVSAGAAGVSAAFNGLANSATIALTNDDLGGVSLDFASGASNATINVGSAASSTADVVLASLAVTDVASVTINSVAGLSAGATATITTATFDTDVKAIVFQTLGGTGSLQVGNGGNASIGGATAITFNANGNANINYDSVIAGGSTLTTVNVNTLGGVSSTAASATLVGIGGTGITTINLVASGAGDIEIGAVALGNGASAVAATATINVTQAVEQDTTIGAIDTTGGMALTINAPSIGSSGSLVMADIEIAEGSATAMAMGVTFNAITISTGASFELDGIDLEGSATGAQVVIGTITMNSGASLDFGSASGISANAVGNVDISSITLVMGASATANFGTIKTTAGAVGNITVNLGDGATATFGAVSASSIGSHSLVLASGASASFGNMQAYSGNNANQGAKAGIEIAGVDGADVSFGTIQASAVGSISVSGALNVSIGAITTTTLGEVNATGLGVSGVFTIDMSGVTNAVEVKLGAAQNTIISGIGNDVITLTGGRTSVAGNDVIQYSTATQGTDNIINFIAGNAASGGDRIEFASADLAARIIVGSALATDASTLVATVATTASGAITIGSGDSIVLINATAFGSTAAFHSAIATGGTLEINMAGASATAGNLVVVWTDGNDSYVSLVAVHATAGTNALVSGVAGIQTLAQLSGVTPAALVAANFDIV